MNRMNSMKIFQKIELLTQKRGLTFYKVGKALGISNSAFSTWKSGRSQPSVNALQKLANFFGVSVDYFLK